MKIVFLLEEPSLKEILNVILPKILPENVRFQLVPHEGKQDLERSITRKLRSWNEPHESPIRFVIVRDNDGADCRGIKQRLARHCAEAGRDDCLIRIVCQELEGWLLGDLQAIKEAFNPPRFAENSSKSKFRDPDRLTNASEELKKLVGGNYKKVAGARAIAPYLSIESNNSRSFQVFIEGVRRITLG